MRAYGNEELEFLRQRNRTPSPAASFTGMAGKSQLSTTSGSPSCFTGPVLGSMRYVTQMLDESHLSMSPSCYSMKGLGFVITTLLDFRYPPRSVEAARRRRSTQWYELPLRPYLPPIDLARQSHLTLMSLKQPTGDPSEKTEAVNVDYPYGKGLSFENWLLLLNSISEAVGRMSSLRTW